MPKSFDPYLKWLGIRDSERPPNHYRLLGLELFESDPEVISAAADRQMAHVRTFQSGPNADLSQTVLNELAVARRCLLNEQSRADYDNGLQTASAKKPPRIRSFYEILGVAPDADEAEIRQGYRRAVQDHHPDHNPDDRRSAKRIRHLNAARDTLLAPDLRKIYDAKLRRRGMLPDQPGEGEPASEASTANSDEFRFAPETEIPDLEPAPSAGFYSHSFQSEPEPQPDFWQAASAPRQRTTSRRKRESRAKFLITLVMVPLGGIAGVSVAILLLWVGFSQDPFGLFQADAKPVAQTVSDTTPSEGPTPLAGDPAPPSTFLTPPANEPNNPSKEPAVPWDNPTEPTTPPPRHGSNPSKEPAVPWDNPTEPTTPPRHGSSTESTAGNAFGKRFAKLEFPTPPQFASLAVGTPIHSDRDSVWSKVPTKLDGLQATQWECLKGRADVNVTSPGYVLMAVSPRWGRGGGKDGKWEKELVTEQELLRDGWKYLDTIYEATDQPEKSLPWSVYGKDFTASEPLRIRTEKYLAPRFFFPKKSSDAETLPAKTASPSPANNPLGKRFAKLEFPTPPQFASLAVGTPIHSDRDSVWSKVPTKLDGLQATQWECLKGRADVNVTSPGYVLMAVSPRWGRGGGKDGKWEKELVTEQELLRDGWKYLDTIYEATDQPEKSLPWSVYGKDFTASEPLRIRTEKYLAPRFFFPVSKTPPGEKKAAGPPRPTDAPFDADTAKSPPTGVGGVSGSARRI